MLCAWLQGSSHTFRLLAKRQSETIPRCRIAAVLGQQHREHREPGKQGPQARLGAVKTRKPKERSLGECFPQEIHTCGNGLDTDFLPNDDCNAYRKGTRNLRDVG